MMTQFSGVRGPASLLVGHDLQRVRVTRYRPRHVVRGDTSCESPNGKEVCHEMAYTTWLRSHRAQRFRHRRIVAEPGPAADSDRRLHGAHRKVRPAGRLRT